MIKKIKDHITPKSNNQGNSFLIVVITLSFLAILTAALLVAIALCYRLKIMDINSRDNFYYLEQAMDEIYAGVGADAMSKLNESYEETLEVIVYYDTETKSYVTMDNEIANKMMKKSYMKKIRNATVATDGFSYSTSSDAQSRLISFMTNAYNASSNTTGVVCTVENVDLSEKKGDNDNITLLNVKLSRTAPYSTVTLGSRDAGKKDFTQTISTDLVIGTPQFDVSFNMIDSSLNDLLSFSMIADKGVEITNSKVNITGDIYAAADFYNKDYNGTTNKSVTDTVVTPITNVFTAVGYDNDQVTKLTDRYKLPVSSYGLSSGLGTDTRFNDQDGTAEKSMYSGLYMSNSNVVVTANKVIVPGSLAAMNASSLVVSAISGNSVGKTDIWADNIIIGGYAMKKNGTDLKGSDVTLNAKCYISDDLEVNATSSDFALIGEYYGYNNSTTDTRSFSEKFLTKNGIFNNKNWDADKGQYQTGQAHYNSSAIIVNGDNASLDLKDVSAMYIAGQSYIELSKKKESKTEKATYVVTNDDGTDKTVAVDVKDEDGNNVTKTVTTTDEDGNEVTTEVNVTKEVAKTSEEDVDVTQVNYDEETGDEYTTSNGTKRNAIQDYKTGEAVSIKSNQLAYIPPTSKVEEAEDGSLYITLPDLISVEPFRSTFTSAAALATAIGKIPVIKTVVSGNTTYFFDFGNAPDDHDANEFIAGYYQLFESGDVASKYLTDITDYDDFSVNMMRLPLKVNSTKTDYTKIYSNSALTVKTGNTFNITADSSAITALVKVADTINDVGYSRGAAVDTINVKDSDGNLNKTDADAPVVANRVTTELQSQYKEVKLLLSNQSQDAEGVAVAHSMGESAITPINYFFNYSLLKAGTRVSSISESNFDRSGFGLWTDKGDVTVTGSGSVKGIVICKGDVKFDPAVTAFEGLIVSGGKVIVDHNIDFVANEEVIKSILRICEDKESGSGEGLKYRQILMLFRNYTADTSGGGITNVDPSEATKSISAIMFEDILSFDNWKKNVTE